MILLEIGVVALVGFVMGFTLWLLVSNRIHAREERVVMAELEHLDANKTAMMRVCALLNQMEKEIGGFRP